MVVRRSRAFAMSHSARSVVALLTVFSVACSGRACGSSGGPSVAQSAAGREPEGRGVTGVSGAQLLAADLRAPLVIAQVELGTLIGRSFASDSASTALGARMEQALAEMEAADRALARESFDLRAVAANVGSNQAKLLEWVRDNTTLVPYRGVLRGSTGVLMDRLGNSLDRALLLAELLQATGSSARLAHATLSHEQAETVLRLRRRPRRESQVPSPGVPRDLAAYAASAQVSPAELRTALDRVAAAAETVNLRMAERVAGQSSDLAAAFGPVLQAAETSAADVEAARDHWWVQTQQGDQWVDLDPTAPDAVPGQPTAAAANVVAVSGLAGDLYHQVAVRVVVEQWNAGAVRERTALQHTFRPLDVMGQRIALRHTSVGAPMSPNAGLTGEQAAKDFERALLTQREWLPSLSIGSTRKTQSSITDAGELNDSPGQATEPRRTGNALGGLVGFGGGDEAPVGPQGRFSAEWIEFEVRSPGTAPRLTRRSVFDLIGPTARSQPFVPEPAAADGARVQRALALLAETDILPLVSKVSPHFVAHLIYQSALSNRETLRQLRDPGASPQRLVDLAGQLNVMPQELLAFAMMRDTWSPVREDVYLNRPNIVAFHRRVRPGQAGNLIRTNSLDIVANDVATWLSSGQEAFRARLTQGVVDTASEGVLVGLGCGGCGPATSVSEQWLSARTRGDKWLLLRSSAESSQPGITLSDDARRRVHADLQEGYAVLVAPKPVEGYEQSGWWRVDPTSGTTIGVMESGEGQGMLENVIVRGVSGVAGIASGYLVYGSCGGFNPGVSTAKQVACLHCAVFFGLATFAFMMAWPTVSGVAPEIVGAVCAYVAFRTS